MIKSANTSSKPRQEQRFAREAEALRKNLEKRKLQTQKRKELKKEKVNGQD